MQDINSILLLKSKSLKESARENSIIRTIPKGKRGILIEVRKWKLKY